MATFDTNTLEGKIAAGLNLHRGSEPQSAVENLAENIAFVIRYSVHTNISGNEVSVLCFDEFDENRTPGQEIMVVVHSGPKDVNKIVSVKSASAEEAMKSLTTRIDNAVTRILLGSGLRRPRANSVVDIIRQSSDSWFR